MEALKKALQRSSAKLAAFEEVEWYFTDPKAREATAARQKAAARIQDWLNAIPTFHTGALALRFNQRDWPPALQAAFGECTSLVVRLECAAHPSEGYVGAEDLETAAVLRLEEMIAADDGEKRALLRLERHAGQHVRAAVRAYLKVRGLGPSVLPAGAQEEA